MKSPRNTWSVAELLQQDKPFIACNLAGPNGGLCLMLWDDRRNPDSKIFWMDDMTVGIIGQVRVAARQHYGAAHDCPALQSALAQTVAFLDQPFTRVEKAEARTIELEQEVARLRLENNFLSAGYELIDVPLVPMLITNEALPKITFPNISFAGLNSRSAIGGGTTSRTRRPASQNRLGLVGNNEGFVTDGDGAPFVEDGAGGRLVGAGTGGNGEHAAV